MDFSDRNPDAAQALREPGWALLAPEQLADRCQTSLPALAALSASWDGLPRDEYLRDGGSYRSRRHGSFIYETASGTSRIVTHRAHWQSTDYNALHGGMERWFEPLEPATLRQPAWDALLCGLGGLFATVRPVDRWYVEAHQFRIDTASGIGRPTPEGAHRDGVDFVVVVLVNRSWVRGGETRVFDADGIAGVRFTMTEPWTALLLDDARVIHETTPIQPEVADDTDPRQPVVPAPGGHGMRDTLVLTFRAQGFQDPPPG